jgi:hypothetical protein
MAASTVTWNSTNSMQSERAFRIALFRTACTSALGPTRRAGRRVRGEAGRNGCITATPLCKQSRQRRLPGDMNPYWTRPLRPGDRPVQLTAFEFEMIGIAVRRVGSPVG